MPKYPGVRYRDDGQPLNDIERMMHNEKQDKDELMRSMVEVKDLLRDVKILLQRTLNGGRQC